MDDHPGYAVHKRPAASSTPPSRQNRNWYRTFSELLSRVFPPEEKMKIKRSQSQHPKKGEPACFTGQVKIYPLYSPPEPSRVTMSLVTFQPGARTAWHSHPLGQTLIVTAGTGWAQREGGPVQEIHHGDIIYFSPRQKHWHGASPSTSMTHIAIHEKLNGASAEWMEHVTDEQYRK
jgi:quercetin dioxygenase-like cupin family protein